MSSQSTSSIPSDMSSNNNQTQRNGSIIEVFKLQGAELLLMDYDDEQTLRFLRNGEFVVNIIMQSNSPVLMVTCMVDELQWPITKDAPVIRIGQRSFAFAMPGLLYGLQFSSSANEDLINTLERVFMKFSQYIDLNRGDQGYPWTESKPNFWSILRSKIENIAQRRLAKFGHVPGRSPFAVGNQASSLLKVIRTSASTKMVGNAILSGFLKAIHIDIQDMRTTGKRGSELSIVSQQAFPLIHVFTNLVEAVEVAWVVASGDSHLLKKKIVQADVKEQVGFKLWRLNQLGIAAFLERLACQSEIRVR